MSQIPPTAMPGVALHMLLNRMPEFRNLLAAAHNLSHHMNSTLPHGHVVFRGEVNDLDWFKDALAALDPGQDLTALLDDVYGSPVGSNVVPFPGDSK